eukprot:COSAG03_NODE_428_length_7981_cov_23.765542_8_plen_167_part_00
MDTIDRGGHAEVAGGAARARVVRRVQRAGWVPPHPPRVGLGALALPSRRRSQHGHRCHLRLMIRRRNARSGVLQEKVIDKELPTNVDVDRRGRRGEVCRWPRVVAEGLHVEVTGWEHGRLADAIPQETLRRAGTWRLGEHQHVVRSAEQGNGPHGEGEPHRVLTKS